MSSNLASLNLSPIASDKENGEEVESYMDSASSLSKKTSSELAREHLIAISKASADTTLDLNSLSQSQKVDGIAVTNSDEDDKFRSELISIAYTESPDMKI
ncbi:hypothetical protein QN277_003410 [Acacia crassicarpa]|uniref:Uncharacterized protein n=2 Tax=Acacia crassicarpa TaxID=499986 RepID=A0AAE1JVR9_9FABA|nr:hypothetical protein QN277_003410 [Acacia crassicarpa]